MELYYYKNESELEITSGISEGLLSFRDKSHMLTILSEESGILDLNGRKVTCQREGSNLKLLIDLNDCDHIFGLGETPLRMRRNRTKFSSITSTAWDYNDLKNTIYSAIPVFMIVNRKSSVCVLINSFGRCDFDFGAEEYDKVNVTVNIKNMEFFLHEGKNPEEALEWYTTLTGKPFEIPEWALGHQISRWSYFPRRSLESVVQNYIDEFPVSAAYLDIDYMDGYRIFTIDSKRFTDMKGMVNEMRSKGIEVVPIIDPGVKFDQNYGVFREFLGDYIEDSESSVYTDYVWPGEVAFPDFIRKSARKKWGDMVAKFMENGFQGIWLDMNEPSTRKDSRYGSRGGNMDPEAVHIMDDGTRIEDVYVHNLFPYFQCQATYEAMRRKVERPFILTRSAYAGCQKYAAIWTGDNKASYEDLKLQLSMVLNLGLSGMPYSGCDLGGFWGETDNELLCRYYEMAVLFPLYRNHKIKAGNDQEIYKLPSFYKERIKKAIETRYHFMGKLIESASEAHRHGHPMVRPLFYNFPDDPETYLIDDQYMLGKDIMVAPQIYESARSREIYLPEGDWFAYPGNASAEGKTWVTSHEKIPLFVRK